ncbi:hypothetical protein [Gemmatimonas groenlandica]|uniref:Glycosyltransferase RgtA/B/C/D-like domain-containing protein n=1 Tax=Gemmatimonas groenlandica TaxID=2732249 RepID=A0A6M4IVZ4_9BACT|nr:hypothetical protein [Gemmatimonas groenlandica]QJR37767.1 hypothetical protein HKW67_20705 [Gemmatimonas groenlandica]
MDEFNADFQALIFRKGRLDAVLPSQWQPVVPAIKPMFVSWLPGKKAWVSSYLPVYAGIRAVFGGLTGLAWITNPILAGVSVLLLAVLSRRLGHGRDSTAFVVVATSLSSQFLLTSMTGYAMPAHLLASVMWMIFYVRRDMRGGLGCALVGVLALGLHNPFPHALFVTPFLIRMCVDRRYRELAVLLPSYVAASGFWLWWLDSARTVDGINGAVTFFSMPSMVEILTQVANAVLVLNWQAPAVGVLAVVSIARWNRLGAFERDLSVGFILTFVFYFLFPSSQGHGWGYRYIYACLPSVVLLAQDAWAVLCGHMPLAYSRRFTLASFAVGAFIQLPWRVYEASSVASPFSRAVLAIQSSDASVVLVHAEGIWYGRDLIRNAPWISEGRVIVNADLLSHEARERLMEQYGDRVSEWSTDRLVREGLERWVR